MAIRKRIVTEHPSGDANTGDLLVVDPYHSTIIYVYAQCQARWNLVRLYIEYSAKVYGRKDVLHRDCSAVVAIAVANWRPTIFPSTVFVESELSPGGSR